MAQVVRLADAPTVTTLGFDQSINERQNEDRVLDSLVAAETAHSTAQRIDVARAVLILTFAAAAIVASFARSLADLLAIAGVVATVGTELLAPLWSAHHTRMAMLLQEHFDTVLFGLPWNQHLGARPLREEVTTLAARSEAKRSGKVNWYVDVSRLPRAYAILLCQRENLVWDFRQRRSWAVGVGIATASWAAIGVVLALVADWTVRELFLRWFGPSLPVVALGLHQVRNHLAIAARKQDAALELESLLSALPSGRPSQQLHDELLERVRKIQDEIARLRNQIERVPQRFYKARRGREEAAARAAAEELRTRLLGRSPAK
jgi:SMODS-associating 4TM effector domain